MTPLATMSRTAILFVATCCCFIVSADAQTKAGPFGFIPGMSKQAIITKVGRQAVLKDDGDILVLKSAPAPHPDLETYTVMVSPEDGVVKVVAYTRTIRSTRTGDQIKEEYSNLKEALSKKYGKPTNEFDFLRSGSLWKESNEWMQSLVSKERTLACFWEHKLRAADDPIALIALEAEATSPITGQISLSYEFDGFRQYMAKRKAKTDSVF